MKKPAFIFFLLAVLILSAPAARHAAASSRLLLMEVVFPPQYDYAPDFDAGLLQERAEAWRDKRLILVGSGDGSASLSGETDLTVAALQLRKSEALRLAHRRAQWLRKELLAIGFRRNNLQIGTLAEAGSAWGGVVKIYALN